ncbi:MAG TPA: group 1 truncated hemoglobin, partial [Gemmataceae bacterium]|nr:group 1 truncated hemoglobin [Gemmataceae bacterium]
SAVAQDTTAVDKLLAEALKDMHNRAADLYNAGDANGCYRMFQGGLFTARPLLAHRPDLQQLIDQGLQTADRQASLAARAKSLHETIEALRFKLRPLAPAKPVDNPTPLPAPMSIVPMSPAPMSPPPMPPSSPPILGPNPATNPAPSAPAGTATLWKRLGEEDGVAKIVDQWLTLALVSKEVNFTRGDRVKIGKEKEEELKRAFGTYIGVLVGGPVVPASTRTMAEVHKGMNVTPAEFDAFVGCLKTALEMNKVTPQDVETLIQKVNATKKEIIGG